VKNIPTISFKWAVEVVVKLATGIGSCALRENTCFDGATHPRSTVAAVLICWHFSGGLVDGWR
jgi:hypothetical protein